MAKVQNRGFAASATTTDFIRVLGWKFCGSSSADTVTIVVDGVDTVVNAAVAQADPAAYTPFNPLESDGGVNCSSIAVTLTGTGDLNLIGVTSP
tara:strand:- start:442 stop:723 length:282 start_codon:yes stop_codon:yes gene_type:complete